MPNKDFLQHEYYESIFTVLFPHFFQKLIRKGYKILLSQVVMVNIHIPKYTDI